MPRMLFLFALSACAPRLMPGFEIEGGSFTDSDVYSVVDDDGVDTTQIQADSQTKWVYFDFETKAEVTEDDPWDLAFQRFKIRMNGGAGGSGNVSVSISSATDFSELTTLPDGDTFVQDTSRDDYVFDRGNAWYYYDLGKHTLTSRMFIYVVRDYEGTYFKMQMINYYDSLGSGGYPAFKWIKMQ